MGLTIKCSLYFNHSIRYWEDTEKSTWEKVGILAENHPNSGVYAFKPQTFTRIDSQLRNMWKWYEFGAIRISVPEDPSCGYIDIYSLNITLKHH